MKIDWYKVNYYLSLAYIGITGKDKYSWRETRLYNWIVNYY